MKKKILILLVSMALLVGVLSGCTEEETTPTNTAPTAIISITQDGLTITYDGSGSTDADDDTLTYSWAFGDVAEGVSTEATGTYMYEVAGDYTVTLTVNDGTVDSEAATEALAIINPPVVTLGYSPETITNETIITFEATATAGTAEINATTGYAWYIDEDVQAGETTTTFIASVFADGTYIVKVMVTDDDGLTAEATVTVEVPTPAVE